MRGTPVLAVLAACQGPAQLAHDTPAPTTPATVTITSQVNRTRFVTREHLLAAGEMQISGEPFAEAMGRDLANYSRDHLAARHLLRRPPTTRAGRGSIWPGSRRAVESYEYSKQPMNDARVRVGRGDVARLRRRSSTPTARRAGGDRALSRRSQHFATGSNAVGSACSRRARSRRTTRSATVNPPAPARRPAIRSAGRASGRRSHVVRELRSGDRSDERRRRSAARSARDDDPGAQRRAASAPTTSATRRRCTCAIAPSQIDPTITPGADGFAGWKYGLWILNYLQVMHDSTRPRSRRVADGDLAQRRRAGQPGRRRRRHAARRPRRARSSARATSRASRRRCSSHELDNRAEDWLTQLTTTDGATLSRLRRASRDALAYDDGAPLRWFPGAIARDRERRRQRLPAPGATRSRRRTATCSISSGWRWATPSSTRSPTRTTRDVGGSQPARAYFDGDPFPADDQLADGEPTLHDRALAMMRVALVNLDRLHVDPAIGRPRRRRAR